VDIIEGTEPLLGTRPVHCPPARHRDHTARGTTAMRKAGGGGADRPLQPADRDPEGDEAEYAPGLVAVNIVDVGYERAAAEDHRTPSIAVFVEDVCTVCVTVEETYGFQPSSVRNQRENILMLVANIWRCACLHTLSRLVVCILSVDSESI
jgi:hypothetical protein